MVYVVMLFLLSFALTLVGLFVKKVHYVFFVLTILALVSALICAFFLNLSILVSLVGLSLVAASVLLLFALRGGKREL